MGHPPTGWRFQDVDEIYIFRVHCGKLGARSGWRTTWEGCASSASAREVGLLPRTSTELPSGLGIGGGAACWYRRAELNWAGMRVCPPPRFDYGA